MGISSPLEFFLSGLTLLAFFTMSVLIATLINHWNGEGEGKEGKDDEVK